MHFAPEGGTAFFKTYGWNVGEQRSVAKEARRLKREMPRAGFYRFMAHFVPKKQREFFSKLDSQFVLLKRNEQ